MRQDQPTPKIVGHVSNVPVLTKESHVENVRHELAKSAARPFVLLKHDLPEGSTIGSHWDLMIQDGDHLATWRLESDLFQTHEQSAERLDSHRLDYLTYEGPISGNRGSVRQVDQGEFRIQLWSENEISGELHGQTNKTFMRMSCSANSTPWLLNARSL